MRLRLWQRALLCAWVAAALAMIYSRGVEVEIDRHVSSRLRYHAIPVAISVLYHGWPHDYTASRALAMNFQGGGPIEDKIAWAVDAELPPRDAVYHWAADDRGMADYVIGAFTLFGPSAQSLYRFYFVVLSVSILLFIIDVGAFAPAAGVLVLLLGALYACIPVIPLGDLTGEPGALFEPRLIELLALIATVHLTLASFIGGKWTARRTAVIGAQAAIVAACYHARSSVTWEVAAVVAAGSLIGLAAWWTRRRRPAEPTAAPLHAMWPAACLVIALAGVTVYQHYAFHPKYFQDVGPRTVWHNALMGFGFTAELRDTYRLAVDDRKTIEAVIAYRARQGTSAGPPWVVDDILASLGGHTSFDWFAYERTARSLYWHVWRTDTASVWRSYLVDKPKAIASVIVEAWNRSLTRREDKPGLYFNPFSLVGLLMVMPGFLLLGHRLAVDSRLAILLLLLPASVIPGLLFYPVVHTMMGAFALIALLIYLAIAYGIGAVMRSRPGNTVLRRLLAARPSAVAVRQRVLVGVWVATALAMIYSRGVDVEIDRHVTGRLRFHAIPAAMSVMYHGWPHDYTASRAIEFNFQMSGPIEDKIAWAVGAKLPADDTVYYWAADDRGMADYVIGAFTLFGPSARSLYQFWFVVLSVSILLFMIDLGTLRPAAGVLILLLGALYACIAVIPLGDLTVAVFEPGSLFEPRIIELLALFATVHLVLASYMGGKWTAARTAVVGAQAAIIAACYHARSSVAWEVAAVLAAGVVMWLAARWNGRRRPAESAVAPAYALWPATCLVIALAGVTAYQHYAFHPRYFQDLGARTVWHNALMGFGFNAELKDKYRLAIDDKKAIEAVVAYRAQQGPSAGPPWVVDDILGSLGGHASFDWFAYEQAARELYWHIWRTDPSSALQCYLVDKPTAIAGVVARGWIARLTGHGGALGLSFNPFSLACLLIVVPGFVLLLGQRRVVDSRLTILLLLLPASLVPGLLFYPVVHSMMGAFALVALSSYLAIAYGIAAFIGSRAESDVASEPATMSPAKNLRLELGLAIGVTVLTLLVAGLLASRGFRAGFTDMAHDGYQLRQILDLHRGGVLFKDTFDQYGPLGPYLNLAGFRLLGETLLAVKYAHAAWYAATALLLFVLARQFLSPWLSAGTVVVWLALAPFYQHGVMVSPHTYVLFFQIVGVLALVRFARSNRLREVAIAGVSAGLCWALKASMGVTFTAGVVLYVVVRWLRGLESARRSAVVLATLLLSMATIVGGALASLWAAGALDDWYLQTIAFPRGFYFEGQTPGLLAPLDQLSRFAFDFMLLNFSVTGVSIPAYWHIVRATVVIAACVLAWRRRAPEAFVVIACVTPLLWVAAYPSANFMHQWWTVSVAIPAFVYCVDAACRWLAARWSRTRGISTVVPAMTVLLLVFLPGIRERVVAVEARASSLSERIVEPAVLAGIYTDPPTAEAFQAIYGAMRNYKRHHPDARVISNDHCDGMTNCVAESLLWLSFLDDNTHDHPVFWPLPVLTTDLYPNYREEFRRSVRESKHLIVDSWHGPVLADNGIEGYELLVGVRQPTGGYWYVLAPSHDDAVAHGERTVRIDQMDAIARESFDNNGGRRLAFENATHGPTGTLVKLPFYSWPAHVVVPRILAPEPLDGYATEFVSAITAVDEGRFTLRGPTPDGVTNQMLFKQQPARSGDYLVITGRVTSGGCQFALTTETGDVGYTAVMKPGPFLLILVPPAPGRYGVRVDCSGSQWWQPLVERGVRAIPDALNAIGPQVDVTLETVGWVRHDSTAPVLYEYLASSQAIHVDLFGETRQPVNGEEVDSELSEPVIQAYEVSDVRAQRSRRAETYSWPTDVTFPNPLPSIQPAGCVSKSDTVSFEEGTWLMNGPVQPPGSDLLRFGMREVRTGDTFAATGVIQEGGIGIALVNRGIKVGGVEITKPGWFAAALRAPGDGAYEIVVDGRASAPLPPGSADWAPRSRFRIQAAGWAAGSPVSPGTRVVFDPQKKVQRCATTYTWPLAHEFPETVPDLHPVESANVQYRAPGLAGDGTRWEMDAQADSPASYLLEGKPLPVRKGGQFIAVGELEAGGLTIGFLKDNAWLGSRNIVEPGWFAVAIQAPDDGVYSLVIANNLKAPDSTRWRSLLGRLGLGGLLGNPQNRFQIHYSGWLDR